MKQFLIWAFALMTIFRGAEAVPEEIPSTEEAPAAMEEVSEDAVGGMMGLTNPMQAVASLDEINAAVGCAMVLPANAEAVSYHLYNITPVLGQCRFTLGGVEYTLRASQTTGDISGFYADGTALGADAAVNAAEVADGAWCRWYDGEMQYSLWGTGADAAAAAAVRDAMVGE